ncbi:MAG: TonB-dependent receptor [Cyclobacteriaceae bacterium]
MKNDLQKLLLHPAKLFLLVCALQLMVVNLLLAQNVSVRGAVTAADGSGGIPGVNIIEQGTSNGVITDVNGAYQISVPTGATLIFSSVGFVTEEITVGNQSVIDVMMESDVATLDEIVVVGYGTSTRRDLTGSIASVSAEEIERAPVANVAQALKGKLPGVNITTQDGRPGADVSIRVRGGGSISQSNNPLFIVDGFPVSSISDIPGSQIESIDVLKDAASTAIYGARGANGVIIVTTKSGQQGRMKINYDGYVQSNTPPRYIETMSARQYIKYNWAYAAAISDGYAEAWEQLWGIGRYAGDFNNTSGSGGLDYYNNIDATNFSKEVYAQSFSHNHSLSLSNGTENTKYILSLNYVDDAGMKINSYYKRLFANLKLDQNLGKKFRLSLNTRLSNEENNGNDGTTSGGGSLLSSSYWFRPIATEDVLGELDQSINTQIGFYDNVLQDFYNPVRRINDYDDIRRSRNLITNVSLSWDILENLTAQTNLGYGVSWGRNNIWTGAIYNNYLDSEGNKTYSGDATTRSLEGWNLRWVNTLNYTVDGLGENHNLSILVGTEVLNSGAQWTQVEGRYYPASFDSERAFANIDQFRRDETGTVYGELSSQQAAPGRLNSYFGRLNYSLFDKYLFNATFRADGSSRFAPNNRWGYFPAASLAWRISEESFMTSVNWLDDLKLRVSYGTVGSDKIDPSLWRQNWTSGGLTRYSINEQRQPSYVPASSTIANPDLKWETTITRNIGLDYTLFNNRIYGTIDVYKNTVEDLLLITPVSAISGFSFIYDNIGSTSNRGVELSINSDLIRTSDFNLRASINVNVNRGRVEELAEGVNGLYSSQWAGVYTSPSSGDYILEEGQPVGLVRGWIYDGWYTTDDFDYADGVYTTKAGVVDIGDGVISNIYGTISHKPGGQTAYPGVPKFRDINGPEGVPDGVVDEYDITIIGDMNPAHTGGFSLGGNYKNIDFAFDFNWSYGNDIYNATRLQAYQGSKEDGLYRNRYAELAGHYQIYDVIDGQITSVTDPAALDALNANATTFLPYSENSITSTFGIEDGSFLRLNTATIGYNFPEQLLQKLNITRLRVYASVFNALTITNYSGLDPEVNTNPAANDNYPTPGLDYGAYPRPRSYTLGLNLQF